MDFGAGAYALALLAGVLTTLSPCVLPLLPILVASAGSAHRAGPWALAAGVAGSFAVGGTLLAAIGASIGVRGEMIRGVGAVLLIAFGAILLSPWLQDVFSRVTEVATRPGQRLLERFQATGLKGQFTLGLVLGLVWSPCVGPTLGAATTLAAQGRHLTEIALLMSVFGLGASAPLILIGSLSRAGLQRYRGSLTTLGRRGRPALGAVLAISGALILTHADRGLESWLLDHSPAWLTQLTTRF